MTKLTTFEVSFLQGGISAGAVRAVDEEGRALPQEAALRASEGAVSTPNGIFSAGGEVQFIL